MYIHIYVGFILFLFEKLNYREKAKQRVKIFHLLPLSWPKARSSFQVSPGKSGQGHGLSLAALPGHSRQWVQGVEQPGQQLVVIWVASAAGRDLGYCAMVLARKIFFL